MKSGNRDFSAYSPTKGCINDLERFECYFGVSVIDFSILVVEKGSNCRIFQQPVRESNQILKDALYFFAKDRKK